VSLNKQVREWNETLNNTLIKMDFRRLVSEPCIYIKENNTKEIYCIIYMWTTYYLQVRQKKIIYVKEEIKMYFNIKDKGDVNFIIGIKFEKCHNGYILHQK